MKFSSLVIILALVFTITSCAKNQITGRRQFKLLPESEMQSMALTQYKQFLTQNKVVSASVNRDAAMVQRVGERIKNAVTKYLADDGKSKLIDGYHWEYHLVENNQANAWCMPGGKIVVYTGLLPITQNEAALAVVMGHEVAHALFQHGNERMSQQLGVQAVGVGLQVAMANKPAETQNLFLSAFGVGSQVGVLLPFSRKHELEADHYGLIFAAMAGYNPREGIALWQRMEKAASGSQTPEFLSTHPAEGRRIEQLERFMPEALHYYEPVHN